LVEIHVAEVRERLSFRVIFLAIIFIRNGFEWLHNLVESRGECFVRNSFHHVTAVNDAAVCNRRSILKLRGIGVHHLKAPRVILEEVRESSIVSMLPCTDLRVENIFPD